MNMAPKLGRRIRVVATTLAILTIAPGSLVAARAAGSGTPVPSNDPFYRYSGTTPLAKITPGTVLKTRAEQMHLIGVTLPLAATQLLYRTTDTLGHPAITVTTVIKPLRQVFATPRLVSYQFAYDSLTNTCQPSYALAGGVNPTDVLDAGESASIGTYLLAGYTVVTSDYEGENLAFAAGPGSGRQTLDGIRAALRSRAAGLPSTTKIGLVGYSGGAIATEWAAQLAPTYAPSIDKRIVGSAQGGVFVNPVHNLRYINGSLLWASVTPAALLGMARGYHLDLTPYLSDYGKKVLAFVSDKCLAAVAGHWPGLTYQKLLKPQYANITKIRLFVKLLNALIMGAHGTPTVPLLFAQGTGGPLEGTFNNLPGIGAGDGVMIAGDVRALAHRYCNRGLSVKYTQYNGLDHIAAELAAWAPESFNWLTQRFDHTTAPNNCTTIKPGNSLAPLAMPVAN